MASDLHARLAASHYKLRRGQVWCRTCGYTERVSSAFALKHGWPAHCGYTMTIDLRGGFGVEVGARAATPALALASAALRARGTDHARA